VRAHLTVMATPLWLVLTVGCATSHTHGVAAPSADPSAAWSPLSYAVEKMPQGPKVVRLPARAETFEAAVFFSGGPLLDPADRPGLTAWTVQTLALATNAKDDRPPMERALSLGVSLVPVYHGNLFGWAAQGPLASQQQSMALLADMVRRPAFPATEMQILGARERQRIEASGEEPLNAMIAVALGYALGLNRPLWLDPAASLFDSVLREDVVRHWRRWFRPSRAVLVVTGRADVAGVWSQWQGHGEAPSPPALCTPHGNSVHHLHAPSSGDDEAVAVFAAAVPGLGSLARTGLGGWFGALGERPAGPVASTVGLEQARRASPSIVDLAVEPGASVGVALSGARGDNRSVLDTLQRVGDLWRPVDGAVDLDGVWGGLRSEATDRRLRSEQPIARSIVAAEVALYGLSEAVTADDAVAFARDLLEPWRYVVVGMGNRSFAPQLEAMGPFFRWDMAGELLSGGAPPRCEPPPDS